MKKLLINSFWLSIFALSCIVMSALIAYLILNSELPNNPFRLLFILWVFAYAGCFIAEFIHLWQHEWKQEDKAIEDRKTGLQNNEWDS